MRPPPTRIVACPQCGKPVSWNPTPTRPFCSKRCQTFDQAAWAAEDYRLPSSPEEPPASEEKNEGVL